MTTQRLLDDFMDLEEAAAEIGVSVRTLRRYMDQPDGLPHAIIGGRTRLHRPTTREWLLGRMKRPNPTRRTRRAA